MLKFVADPQDGDVVFRNYAPETAFGQTLEPTLNLTRPSCPAAEWPAGTRPCEFQFFHTWNVMRIMSVSYFTHKTGAREERERERRRERRRARRRERSGERRGERERETERKKKNGFASSRLTASHLLKASVSKPARRERLASL